MPSEIGFCSNEEQAHDRTPSCRDWVPLVAPSASLSDYPPPDTRHRQSDGSECGCSDGYDCTCSPEFCEPCRRCEWCQATRRSGGGEHYFVPGQSEDSVTCDVCSEFAVSDAHTTHPLTIERNATPEAPSVTEAPSVRCETVEMQTNAIEQRFYGYTGAMRTCRGCSRRLPATAHYFYQYPSNRRLDRCIPCKRAYNRSRYQGRSSTARSTTSGIDNRRFGVEIEFIGNPEEVAHAIRSHGIACMVEEYGHTVRTHWKIVPDGSVNYGAELVSPILRGADGRDQLRKVCDGLREAGASVNQSTGLHVHHDCRDLDIRAFGRVVRFYHTFQDSIDTMVTASRRNGNNCYCGRLRDGEVEMIESLSALDRQDSVAMRTLSSLDRYRTVNVCSYPRYGTIEIRQHQGTINVQKIDAWVSFGQSIIAWSRTDHPMPEASVRVMMLARLVSQGGLPPDTADYLERRSQRLGGAGIADDEQYRRDDGFCPNAHNFQVSPGYPSECRICGYPEHSRHSGRRRHYAAALEHAFYPYSESNLDICRECRATAVSPWHSNIRVGTI